MKPQMKRINANMTYDSDQLATIVAIPSIAIDIIRTFFLPNVSPTTPQKKEQMMPPVKHIQF